eukprot:jgi/Orpsp1_1/1178095/evm.model.c7180000064015.1
MNNENKINLLNKKRELDEKIIFDNNKKLKHDIFFIDKNEDQGIFENFENNLTCILKENETKNINKEIKYLLSNENIEINQNEKLKIDSITNNDTNNNLTFKKSKLINEKLNDKNEIEFGKKKTLFNNIENSCNNINENNNKNLKNFNSFENISNSGAICEVTNDNDLNKNINLNEITNSISNDNNSNKIINLYETKCKISNDDKLNENEKLIETTHKILNNIEHETNFKISNNNNSNENENAIQNNNTIYDNHFNEIIKPNEIIYEFPIYEFKKNKTLRSKNPICNPRYSTQNNLNYELSFNNYFKSAKWSPDGTCILSSSNDNNLRLFELPDITKNKEKEIQINPVLKVCDGENIYDYTWYPYMKSSDPSTAVFISASRDLPIHMWDAYYGTIRASYCTYDIYDQIVAPHSINFNSDGSKIYAGLNNLIQIFDISRPGEPINKKLTTPTRKSKHGQKGIIACMDFNPDYSGLLAAGSLSKSIGIYDTNNSNELIFQQKKLKGGVIQVQFSPDGNYLYSVSRQTDGIICWDIRNTGKKLCEYIRPGITNQRISFDISKDGKYLISGDK